MEPTANVPFELPQSWSKDFQFSVHSGVGMQDESTVCTYTYDTCKYVHREGSKKTIISFPLKEAYRVLIFKKLHELNVDKIRSKKNDKRMSDEAVAMICFHSAKVQEYCLSDGGEEAIQKEDLAHFGAAYRFLMNYGKSKGQEKN